MQSMIFTVEKFSWQTNNQGDLMTKEFRYLTIIVIACLVALTGCSQTNNALIGEGSEGGEESGNQLALDETYDYVRNGVRLILNYNAQNNTFEGTIENTTDQTIDDVRVEIHLSNGTELGPTPNVDLTPGEKKSVELLATTQSFTGWTPHAEVGSGGDSIGGEHAGGTDN